MASASSPSTSATSPPALGHLIARRCQRRGWQAWIKPLTAWLPAFLTTPLALPDGGQLTLAGVHNYRAEMEFWFEANRVGTLALDRLVTAHTLQARPRPALQPDRLNGMLKGFIDLVFAHEGRYYVADYKSNRLGRDDRAYGEPAMRDAVVHHRYDLQYALYLFALHRLLRARLGEDYDYDRHVGGVVYLFLRGHASPSGGLHLEKPPVALMDELDALFGAGGAA